MWRIYKNNRISFAISTSNKDGNIFELRKILKFIFSEKCFFFGLFNTTIEAQHYQTIYYYLF
jgi:hypothetical protein